MAEPQTAEPAGADDGGSALERLRRVLLPPLRFASQDAFSKVERLKGLPGLVDRTLDSVGGGLPAAFAGRLRELAADFDDAGKEERRERVQRMLRLLEDGPGVVEAPAAPPKATSRAPTKRAPRSRAPSPRVEVERARVVEATQDVLDAPVTVLKGFGPAKAEMLAARDLVTVGDLLAVLPRAYQDRRGARSLSELLPGAHAVAHGRVVLAGAIGKGRGGRFEVLLEDDRGRLKLIFFHFNLWDMKRRFAPGSEITVSGEVTQRGGALQMVHPRVVQGERTDDLSGLWPVYPEVGGLHPAELGRAITAALDVIRSQPPREVLPEHVRRRAGVVGIGEAYEQIHAPPADASEEELRALTERDAPAFRRLAFEELFVLQLAMGLKRRAALVEPAPPLDGPGAPALAKELLPFPPTGAQLRATSEILSDVARDEPMGRLLQGDVGAGKTAVAALACLRAVRAGFQAAIMAPTEILAEQHKATLERQMRPLGVRVAFISGSLRGKPRKLAAARLKNHEIDVAVGTQALLSDDIRFARLGLCVIDEQHRFGVVQRVALKQKGPTDEQGRALTPHLLVMTATPIPRSLALTIHGDLAVSVIDELPPGRTPVKTRVLVGNDDEKAWVEVGAALDRGERAYVVYPLIEESEKMDLLDATRGYEDLAERFGKDRVGLLHGRMSADDKERVMGAFARGELSVLVSTTVIEVGVDVPEATCMVVMHAERFGLSQLHQLRGRVGRSERLSRCFLVVGADGAGRDARRRLQVLEDSNDGFRIAEEDLAIRGPGDFLGTRQSGLPTLLFSDFSKHARLIEVARALATELLDEDPLLARPEHEGLRVLVERRFKDRLVLTGAG